MELIIGEENPTGNTIRFTPTRRERVAGMWKK
jgi:hypothetical protein